METRYEIRRPMSRERARREARMRTLLDTIWMVSIAAIAVALCLLLWAGLFLSINADRKEEPVPAETQTAAQAPVAAVKMMAKPEEPEAVMPEVGQSEEPEVCFSYDPNIPLSAEHQEELWFSCMEFDVPYALMLGLIEKETNFRNIIGDEGESEGFCQIQKKWHSELMEKIGAEDLMVPLDNFRTGCAILSNLLSRYGGDESKALTAYNQGYYNGVVTKYAKKVLSNAKAYG